MENWIGYCSDVITIKVHVKATVLKCYAYYNIFLIIFPTTLKKDRTSQIYSRKFKFFTTSPAKFFLNNDSISVTKKEIRRIELRDSHYVF